MAQFVLVHGGWQGGWSYKRLAKLLREDGHEVYTPTLTGLGERSHLAYMPVNLETHVSDVANVIVWEDLTDVILVGHSYGGMVITGVADRLSACIDTLVYLDALVPKDGDTLLGLRPEYLDTFLQSAARNGGRLIAPPAASDFDASAEYLALLDAKTVPHPLNCFTQALVLSGAYKQVPNRIYIYAQGGIFDGAYDAFASEPGSKIVEITDSGHTIMLDQPDRIAALFR
jgi:pimeloyl-ACP methyl ester carboxylesterase